MVKKVVFPIALVIVLALSACNLSSPATPTVQPTSPAPSATVIVPTVPAPTNTLPPTAVPTQVPSSTPLPLPTASLTAVSIPAAPSTYIDDRSTPSQVIVSFYNAIDRQEYLRAYSYWRDPSSLGTFDAFSSGYTDTASVDLVFGAITGDPGMSQVYYTIPVILKVTTKSNAHNNFSACYVVHETNPSVYGAPPVEPMSIAQGSAQPSSLSASDASVLAAACNGVPAGGNPPFAAYFNGINIGANNFVDNRSGAVETVSSLLNAINLQQYVRAYSYFQDPTTFPGPYDPYAAGFSNTGTITVTFGAVQNEGAAGSLYYKVPLAESVLTTSNTTQTFVGCYVLRLAQPTVQGTPPFQPMGIISGKFNQVANSSNITSLLSTACN